MMHLEFHRGDSRILPEEMNHTGRCMALALLEEMHDFIEELHILTDDPEEETP